MSLESYLRGVRAKVRRDGFTSVPVYGSRHNPPHTYTVGMSRKHHGFELIIIGIQSELAHQIFCKISDWRELPLDEPVYGIIADLPVMFKLCLRGLGHHYARTAQVMYGDDVKVVQVVMPDDCGRLPGDPGFTTSWQPQLWGKLMLEMNQLPVVFH